LAGEFYFSDPVMFGAYLLYFWPVSYVQARLALAALPNRPTSVLDLGGGAGPLLAAAYDSGIRELRLADRSRKALQWAEELFKEMPVKLTCVPWDPVRQSDVPHGGKTYSLISFQHVLNELWQDQPEAHARRLTLLQRAATCLQTEGQLLILEPALKETSQATLALRDALITSGLTPVYPCTHAQPCPALKADDSCHAEGLWEPPELVRDLLRRAGLHKTWLKMTTLVMKRASETVRQDSQEVLVVDEPRREKTKKIVVSVCGAQGRMELALSPREATEEQRFLFKVKPGERLRVPSQISSHDRIELNSESKLERVSPSAPMLRILAG
jgi:ribosomal protein RSM22 (predicted rRNA methylase)